MSKMTLDSKLMGIPLSKTNPQQNYSSLFEEITRDRVFNETIDDYLTEHPIKSKRPNSAKRNFRKNTVKLIIAHVLYQRFEKYRDKHFGPGIFARYNNQESSTLNKELNHTFTSVYDFFRAKRDTLDLEDMLKKINKACRLNIHYEKYQEGGVHKLKRQGITSQEFLELYTSYRTELMQDPRINTLKEEANMLFDAPGLIRLKKPFVEVIINIILAYRLGKDAKKYSGAGSVSNSSSKLNLDSNRLFERSFQFFRNHSDIFGEFSYAYDFIRHCGFEIEPNPNTPWRYIQAAGIMDGIEDTKTTESGNAQLLPIAEYFTDIDPRSKKVLVCRYGLNGGPEMSLAKIGRIYHLSRERIRQIEFKALANLKERIEIEQQVHA